MEIPAMMLADCLKSRYLLHRMLADVFNPIRAALAVDVLLGPEPGLAGEEVELDGPADEWAPSPEDEADYAAWSRELEDRLLQARMQSDFDDTMEELARFTEADARAAGLAV